MMSRTTGWLIIGLIALFAQRALAQERTAPLRSNAALTHLPAAAAHPAVRGTATLTLPFFEDFTDSSPYPNPARWVDSNVYINNTMALAPISRGVATFDALNKRGRPYDTLNATALNYADSLTSQGFDFSNYTAADNIYLSFFYQPQGLGFSPEPQDSLMLFFRKKNGGWAQIWADSGSTVKPFRQVIVPVRDTSYLFADFQFRFVAKASINSNDDIWNVDYIRMAVNRSPADTSVNDLAFTTQPTNLLKDYTSMPYRHFLANTAAEQAPNFSAFIWNHYATNATVNYGFIARESVNNFPLSGSNSTINIPAYNQRTLTFPNYTALAPASNNKVIFENKFFLQSGNPNEPKANDTIIHNQVFDNYFAYDDGSAEKSYYLNLLSTLPGKTAIEFHTNVADTLQGIAIYFGQQVPTASSKLFSIAAYKELAGINGSNADSVMARRNNLVPLFTDSINGFTVYKFLQPVHVFPGYFYVGYIQPANSGSDSLYIGLDVARNTANHLYFNVLDVWNNSTISGALMVRPLMGGAITGTGVAQVALQDAAPGIYPNPAGNYLYVRQSSRYSEASVTDITGREVIHTTITDSGISLTDIMPGIYFVRFGRNGFWTSPQKIIKQ